MPLLKIQINQSLTDEQQVQLLNEGSSLVASELAKPEQYVMVIIEPAAPMIFAGKTEPAAYLELKSIGLPESKTQQLSRALCQLVEDITGVEQARTYIEFAGAARAMWGWDGRTF